MARRDSHVEDMGATVDSPPPRNIVEMLLRPKPISSTETRDRLSKQREVFKLVDLHNKHMHSMRLEGFRFLDLPPKARKRIYEFSLLRDEDRPFDITSSPRLQYYLPQEPAIMFVCRQIRHEAMSIFWGGNIITSQSSHSALRFLQNIPAGRARFLKDVHMIPSSCVAQRIQVYGYMDYLQHICIRMRMIDIIASARGFKLGPDVFKVPLGIEGEGMKWVTASELNEQLYLVHRNGIDVVIRKAKHAQPMEEDTEMEC